MTLSSLFQRILLWGVALNYVALVPYLVFVAIGMNMEFVFRDPAKLAMHLFLVPFAMLLLSGVYVALNLDAWPRTAQRVGVLIAFLLPATFGAFAIGKGVQDFQYPNASRLAAAYPSDYYNPWWPTQATDTTGKIVSLGVAAKTLYEGKRDAAAYAKGLSELKVVKGNGNRDISFIFDAGPAGWLGPALSALAAAVGGFTVAAAVLACLALYHRFPLGATKPYPKLLASFLVLAIGFLPMHWLTSKVLWSQTPCCEPLNFANTFLVLLAIGLFAVCALFIYLQIRYTRWVRVLSALVLGVIALFPAGTGDWLMKNWPWFAVFIQRQRDDPIIALGVSTAITIVVALCAALVISPRRPAQPPRARTPKRPKPPPNNPDAA